MKTNLPKVHAHLFFIDDPIPSSYASLLLLNRHLRSQDYDHPKTWLKVRKNFLYLFRKKHGTIKCEYCGRTNLKMKTKHLEDLATIDHAIPRSITKKKYDPKNFKVACHNCNQEKKTMTEFQFRKYLFKKALKNNWAIKRVINLFGKYCYCFLKIFLTLI